MGLLHLVPELSPFVSPGFMDEKLRLTESIYLLPRPSGACPANSHVYVPANCLKQRQAAWYVGSTKYGAVEEEGRVGRHGNYSEEERTKRQDLGRSAKFPMACEQGRKVLGDTAGGASILAYQLTVAV